jgi:4-amino-4-deoxy-L-arabinose transferase-like glycosyltransferase
MSSSLVDTERVNGLTGRQPRGQRAWLLCIAIPAALALVYAAVLLFRLDRVPLLNPDEAAYTEPAWTLLTSARFAAPMYTGMFAIDRRWYFLWPGYGILATVPYALFGAQVVAVRLLSGAFGAVLLLATWWLARQVLRDAPCAPARLVPAAGPVAKGTVQPPPEGSTCSSLRRRQAPPPRRTASRHGVPARLWRVAPHAAPLLATVLVALHPTIFFLSRFGRPEIAVAAFAILSSALGVRAWRSPERRRWHLAAGAAAGLSFLMHQYGAFAIVALGASYLLRPRNALGYALRQGRWALLGLGLALAPWLIWIGSDWPEFRAQLGAQLAYQRWRYPQATLARNALIELPARYVLNRQDYPAGWRPWEEALVDLLGPRAAGPQADPAAPALRRAAHVARYWLDAGPALIARWLGLAILVAAAGGALVAAARRQPTLAPALRWLGLPLGVWLLGLALIPNKWQGYTGAVAAYSTLLAVLLAWAIPGRRQLAGAVFLAGALVWGAVGAGMLLHPPSSYAQFAGRLRALVPAGEPVACAMREWFAFAGRNPAYTVEFRSVPAFRTSVLELIATQRPRYLVLHRTDGAGAPRQRYHFIYPPWEGLYQYIDASTELVGVVSDPWFGTVEVRRVLAWPQR